MSLKSQLLEEIERKDIFTYHELVDFCRTWGAKVSNLERRMREAVNDDLVTPVRSRKGAIIGWRKKENQGVLF